jgi:ferritin-like metal-binding protein YciE
MEGLKELLIEELKDIYSAEQQLVKVLPRLVEGSDSDELKTAISDHLEETKIQVKRLEQVFGIIGEKASAEHCKGMEGLLEEGAKPLEEEEEGTLRDLRLIGAAQRVEHYEVAAYGTAKAIAEKLGFDEAVELLDETLNEESAADEKLTEVAESLYDTFDTEIEEDEVEIDDPEAFDEDETDDDEDEDADDAEEAVAETEEVETPAKPARRSTQKQATASRK